MRPITSFTLHAILAAALTAFAATSAAAQYLALGDSIPGAASAAKNGGRGGGWIEIQGWDWGETQAQAGAGKVEHEWKVEEGESAPPEPGAAKLGAVGGSHRDSGVSEKLTVDGGRTEAGKKPKTTQKMLAPGATRPTSASTAPAEKRQHGWVTVSKPLDRGAVRVKVKFPWASCAVGARYPALTLGDDAQRYVLQDAIITSCSSASSGGGLPMEEVSFNYAKVKVRGWDPEKKEE